MIWDRRLVWLSAVCFPQLNSFLPLIESGFINPSEISSPCSIFRGGHERSSSASPPPRLRNSGRFLRRNRPPHSSGYSCLQRWRLRAAQRRTICKATVQPPQKMVGALWHAPTSTNILQMHLSVVNFSLLSIPLSNWSFEVFALCPRIHTKPLAGSSRR